MSALYLPKVRAVYFRSNDGKVIHVKECRHRGAAVRWLWADDKTDRHIEDTVARLPWLRPCGHCLPTWRKTL